MDNLESSTYEVFEKDPVKYDQYRKAIKLCLSTKHTARTAEDPVILMVVGAGRGPLVTASLQAAKSAGVVHIKIYAVEKNVNAIVTLELLNRTKWIQDDVTIVSSDMREWNAPHQADVIVSELLGSFGDNELSPECLDGAMRFLKKDSGVSIPANYTSYLAPVSSQKLFNEVVAQSNLEKDKPKEEAFEMPYVVRLHNFDELAEPKPVFTFVHPTADDVKEGGNSSNNVHLRNSRYIELSFDIKADTTVHGFSGYFECELFNGVSISILPRTHSPGMFSWFPIFFPLVTPLQVRAGDRLAVNMWRICSNRKVWYEWAVSGPVVSAIHNPGGRSYTIGL